MNMFKLIICFCSGHNFKYYEPQKYDNEELEKLVLKIESGTLATCKRCGVSVGEYLKS